MDELRPHETVVKLIGELDTYSAVAGRSNGRSIGMTKDEAELSEKLNPVRLTGPALGSNTTSLMSFFTTAWREKLKDIVLQEAYPAKPFQLIKAEKILGAVNNTKAEHDTYDGQKKFSQTEFGMLAVWDSLVGPEGAPKQPYGENTENYRKTAGLAWLAINAETNIRQNEKMAGVGAGIAPQPQPATHKVYVVKEPLTNTLTEIDLALSGYQIVDPNLEVALTTCAGDMRKLIVAAIDASKDKENLVVEVDPSVTAFLAHPHNRLTYEFKPLIADIGSELLKDPEGLNGQRDFNLHLATGHWREVPVKIGEGDTAVEYLAGTPSAFVLHLKGTTSPADWQPMVIEHDQVDAEKEE